MTRHSLIPLNFKKYVEPLNWLRRDIDTLFDNFWGSSRLQPQSHTYERDLSIVPDVDLSETDNEFIISVELPGLEEKDINIEVCDNILRIRGEKILDHEEKDKNFYRIERVSGAFDRSIQLPGSIRDQNIQAKLKNGVLTITFPKSAEATSKTKHIEVQTG